MAKEMYVAIKVKGMHPWLWFDKTKVVEKEGKFIGKEGWGRGGAPTNIEVDVHQIEGRIESSELQYGQY